MQKQINDEIIAEILKYDPEETSGVLDWLTVNNEFLTAVNDDARIQSDIQFINKFLAESKINTLEELLLDRLRHVEVHCDLSYHICDLILGSFANYVIDLVVTKEQYSLPSEYLHQIFLVKQKGENARQWLENLSDDELKKLQTEHEEYVSFLHGIMDEANLSDGYEKVSDIVKRMK